ncbi:MAG: AcrB/AcrD/AcrF family protein, partial [Candidatus Aminicenantes bacterium]|nr:AcrB/AcrD/AcrF family protein [Gammaproteobacteria bacterium]NIO80687.1 AcrB/AcrD/AcrF family protein [Candidatus Aminicenantes bacterium]NIQ66550.1 AcrB/AcrD/AcrF family protein [Candidatus Aminicenantes bacterium]NIT22579.1 AcrB/AcrD/AcrF family protein [Candidatus Aminicenantes bacterium]
MLFAPPGYNIDEMHDIFRDMEDFFVPHVGEDPEKFARGESNVPGLNFVMGYASSDRMMILPEATSRKQVDQLMEVTQEKIRKIPGVISVATRGSIFSSNFGGTRSINVDISGSDMETLFDVGFKAFIKSKEIFDNPQVRPQPPSLSLGQPLLEVHPD